MSAGDESKQRDAARDGLPRYVLWILGTGIVLMLGGFALMPLIPNAPVGVQMSVVIVGVLLFGVGMTFIRIWIVAQAQEENKRRRQKGPARVIHLNGMTLARPLRKRLRRSGGSGPWSAWWRG
jgi:hypothetical protein